MGAMPVEDEFLEDLVADFRFIQVRSRSFLISLSQFMFL